MAGFIKGLKSGFHNSTGRIGKWNVPQEAGDDKPRGNRNYDAWEMVKAFSTSGITKLDGGLNIINGGTTLSKGEAIVNGFYFRLDEDTALNGAERVLLGINNNEGERQVYIDFDKEPIQEKLERDKGIYEVIMWDKHDDGWHYVLPISTTINDYQLLNLTTSDSRNIYNLYVHSFPQVMIDTPLKYNFGNISLKAMVDKIGVSGNTNVLRVHKGDSFFEANFDDDAPIIGVNTIFFYIKDNKVVATTGGVK